MKCPSCTEVTLLLSTRENIEIDYCPQCRGVWLDRGELDKIIERSDNAGPIAPEPRATSAEPRQLRDREDRYDDDDDDDDDDRRGFGIGTKTGSAKKKKRRGFLSEMFEFGE